MPTARARGTLQTRRSFLRTSAARARPLPGRLPVVHRPHLRGAQCPSGKPTAATQIVTGTDGPILVVLQQAGGNDGLNMLPPWADDAYHRARPTLGHPADKVLKLNDYCGLHPVADSALKGLYDEGHLAVVQGVGLSQPQPLAFPFDRDLADRLRQRPQQCSLRLAGQYFDNCCQGAPPTVGVSIGGQMPQAFASPHPTGVSVRQPGTVSLDRRSEEGPRSGEMSHGDRTVLSGRSTRPKIRT